MKVVIKNLSKSFNKKEVLKNINLSFDEKNIFCLLGPSGSGKTTLIRLILGAIKGDEGEIYIDRIKSPNLDLLNKIGFMPQEDALYNDLSGYDNLMFFGELQGLRGKKLKNRIAEVLELLELTEDSKKKVINYSGGMKKRLSLGIALIHKPKLLLLDEPTVGIDPILRKKIWNQFKEENKNGVGILITTHVMDEAKECDYAGLIYGGRMIIQGPLEKLLNESKDGSLESLFLNYEEIR